MDLLSRLINIYEGINPIRPIGEKVINVKYGVGPKTAQSRTLSNCFSLQ